jgi:opacity protein-like surface antigen
MRRFAFAALATLAMLTGLALATPAAGALVHEGRGDFAAGLLGGLTQPTGQLADRVNLSSRIGDSGLNFRIGPNAGAYIDYFLADHVVLGFWGGSGWLHMNDLNVQTGSGMVKVHDMVNGRTVEIGGYLKVIGEPRGRWTPSVFAGLTSFHRKAQISRDALKIFPRMTLFELTDAKLGFTGGAGLEYMATEQLGLDANLAFHFSGRFTHAFDWAGYQTAVRNWNFNTFGLGLAYHFGVKE